MTYVLVYWDESGGEWKLHDESDGSEVGGPWDERPKPQTVYTEMGRDLIQSDGVPRALGAVMASDYYTIQESSDTPFPWGL